MNFNTLAVDRQRAILDRIIEILPGAVVAGGFLRDLLVNKSTRDIDVFTERTPTTAQLAALQEALDTSDFYEADPLEKSEEYLVPEADTRRSRIVALFKADGVDVIVTNDLEAHLREFPDNISKVSYRAGTSGGVLEMTDEFVTGHTQRRIVYREAAGEMRLLKLIDKFSDYSVSHV